MFKVILTLHYFAFIFYYTNKIKNINNVPFEIPYFNNNRFNVYTLDYIN